MLICGSKSNFTVQGFLIKKKKKKLNKALLQLYAITVAGARRPSFAEHDHSNEQTSVMLVFFFFFLFYLWHLCFFYVQIKNSIQFNLGYFGMVSTEHLLVALCCSLASRGGPCL